MKELAIFLVVLFAISSWAFLTQDFEGRNYVEKLKVDTLWAKNIHFQKEPAIFDENPLPAKFAPPLVFFRAFANASQSVNTDNVLSEWYSLDELGKAGRKFNIGNHFNEATGRFISPRYGIYRMTISVRAQDNSTNRILLNLRSRYNTMEFFDYCSLNHAPDDGMRDIAEAMQSFMIILDVGEWIEWWHHPSYPTPAEFEWTTYLLYDLPLLEEAKDTISFTQELSSKAPMFGERGFYYFSKKTNLGPGGLFFYMSTSDDTFDNVAGKFTALHSGIYRIGAGMWPGARNAGVTALKLSINDKSRSVFDISGGCVAHEELWDGMYVSLKKGDRVGLLADGDHVDLNYGYLPRGVLQVSLALPDSQRGKDQIRLFSGYLANDEVEIERNNITYHRLTNVQTFVPELGTYGMVIHEGGGMNLGSGVYTAPETGVYEFSINSHCPQDVVTHVAIVTGDYALRWLHWDGAGAKRTWVFGTTIHLFLEEGEQAWLEEHSNDRYEVAPLRGHWLSIFLVCSTNDGCA